MDTPGNRPVARSLVFVAGCTVIALALPALLGVGPPSLPAVPPSEISFPAIICGLALILLALGRIAIPTGLAFAAGTWTLLVASRVVRETMAADAFAVPPIRLSVLMPAALVITCLGLLHFPLLTTGTALCGVCVLAIGCFQLLLALDVAGVTQLVGVRPEQAAPLAMAALVIALGIGVTAAVRLRPATQRRLGYTWAPTAATMLLVMGSVVLWQAFVHLQTRDLARLTRAAAGVMATALVREVRSIGAVLETLAARPPDPARSWVEEADVLRRTAAGVLALSYDDANLDTVQQIWLGTPPTEVPPPSDTDRLLLERAAGAHTPIATTVRKAADGRRLLRIMLPRVREGQPPGFVTALLDIAPLVREAFPGGLQDYAVRIEAGGERVFDSGELGAVWDAPTLQRRVIPLPGGTEWTLVASPSRALRRTTRTAMPEIVVASTLLLALLLGSTLAMARASAAQATELAREAEQRERAERETRAMAIGLEQRVQERTEELRRANSGLGVENAMRRRAEMHLRRSNDDLRQFAAFVSHELRQPLSTIGIWSELLETGDPPLTEKQTRHVGKIRASVARMARLIESELALAQLSHGEVPREQVNLSAIVSDVRSEMAPLLEQAGARIDTGRLCTVLADPQQLRLLFRNLFENALKYRSTTAPAILVEETNPDDPAVCEITVRDNGRGFTGEMAERMFTIFDRSADHTVPGIGIGLAICRRIVERHGGRITAVGEPGVGALFIIRLPRAGGELEGPASSEEDTGPSETERRSGT